MHGAHVASHGQGRQRYMQVAEKLNANIHFTIRTDWKHAKNHLVLLVNKLKREEFQTVRASGMEEDYQELHQLLTDISSEMEEIKRINDARWEAAEQKEDHLKREREMIRDHVMRRWKGLSQHPSMDEDQSKNEERK